MNKLTTTTEGVEKLLNLLNPKKAIGPDKIPTSIIKDNADILAPLITKILQQSIDWQLINTVESIATEPNHTNAPYLNCVTTFVYPEGTPGRGSTIANIMIVGARGSTMDDHLSTQVESGTPCMIVGEPWAAVGAPWARVVRIFITIIPVHV